MCEILKATNCTIAGEYFFLQKINFFNSKVCYATALKFSAKQSNLIAKKSLSAICEIVNINVDFRTFVSASHNVFSKKNTKTNKIKSKFFFENRRHNCRECYDLDMYQNSAKNINIWWSWSS